MKLIALFSALLSSAIACVALQAQASSISMRGVNLPSGGFAANMLPGIHGQNYVYPTASDISKFSALGMNTIRVSFLWERLQPALNTKLNATELGHLDAVVAAAKAQQMNIVLDLHNYGAYRANAVGSADVPTAALVDVWRQLATHYRDEPLVIFGLMNEPYKQNPAQWAAIAQSVISAIRKTGAKQWILVSGARYSSAASWLQKDGDLSNGDALAKVKDPARHMIIEVHQYFDVDTSGTHDACVDGNIGVARLTGFTSWLRERHLHGFLGEFGASKDPVCVTALDNTLAYMAQNSDVWQGWTYWAAAAWFGNYRFNIFPPDPQRYPQVPVLEKYLH